jgi:hypothetical protein
MERIRKITFLTILLFTAGFPALSQLKLGVKGGLNLATISFDKDRTTNNLRAGFNAGMLAESKVRERLYVRPELLYSLKGWSFSKLARGGRVSLHYLNLPLLIGYKPAKNITLLLGPELGLLLKHVVRYEDIVENYTRRDQKPDVGIAAGFAYKISPKLGLEARYTHGLSRVAEVGLSPHLPDGRNRVISFGLIYLLTKASSLPSR